MTIRPLAAIGAAGIAATLVLGLAACTQAAESSLPADHCVPIGHAGDASASFEVTGKIGESADVTLTTPVYAESLDVRVSGEGTGSPVTEHGVIAGNFTVVDARNGDELVDYGPLRLGGDGGGAPATVASIRQQLPGLADAAQCARAGERVTAIMPATAFFGEAAQAQLSDPSTPIIAVIDVTRVYLSSAAGPVLPPVDSIPAVVTAPSGQPGVTMPQQAPPGELRSALRVSGYGSEVRDGDELVLHVSIFSWESGQQLASTWNPANSVLQTTASAAPAADGLFGATSALVGETVGSQVIVVVPAAQAAELPGPVNPLVIGNDTIVLVIDILDAHTPGA